MSLELVSYSPGICVRCGGAGGEELAEGDVVKIYLNQERLSTLPEWIDGIVTGVAQASATDTSKTYTIQYSTEDLEGALTELNACDISSLICTSCCDILQDRIDAWEDADEPAVSLGYYWNEAGQVVLLASAYSGVPGVTITAYGWAQVTTQTALSPSGPVTQSSTIVPDSEDTDFLGGLYEVNVTDSAGHSASATVFVDPTRIKLRSVTAELATTSDSTIVVTLNAGESIAAQPVITTAGAGVGIESVTQVGTTMTINFTNTPLLAPVGVSFLVKHLL